MARFPLLSCLVLIVFAFSLQANAKQTRERTQFSRDLRIEAGENAGEVTCINCSIYIRGKVEGDVTAIRGNIIVEEGAAVSGEVTAVWGNIRVDNGASISGDTTSVAGALRAQPQANIGGDRTSLDGKQWLAAIILPPLVVIGLIVALIVWLVQRSRRPTTMPVGQISMG